VTVRALSLSQQAVHAQLSAGARQGQIARRVVQAMDPALSAEILPASHDFDAYTRAYDTTAATATSGAVWPTSRCVHAMRSPASATGTSTPSTSRCSGRIRH
jgi:hypothetical protein